MRKLSPYYENKGMCQIKDCPKIARYALYKTDSEFKQWVYVCPKHEGEIGDENLRRGK